LRRELNSERFSGNIPRIKLVRGGKIMNDSQFFDDTLLMGSAYTIMVERFKRLLGLFKNSSGGKVQRKKVKHMGGILVGICYNPFSESLCFLIRKHGIHLSILGCLLVCLTQHQNLGRGY
jgi:hypothetical protein